MWMPAGPAPTIPILDVLHLGPRTGWNGEPGSVDGVQFRKTEGNLKYFWHLVNIFHSKLKQDILVYSEVHIHI